MVCVKDGSTMREVLIAPEFSVWSCIEACHSVRVGAPPPVPTNAHDSRRDRKRLWKDDRYCDIPECTRERLEGRVLCAVHRAAARKRARRRARLHLGLKARRYDPRPCRVCGKTIEVVKASNTICHAECVAEHERSRYSSYNKNRRRAYREKSRTIQGSLLDSHNMISGFMGI
jgi:hypothetical protein